MPPRYYDQPKPFPDFLHNWDGAAPIDQITAQWVYKRQRPPEVRAGQKPPPPRQLPEVILEIFQAYNAGPAWDPDHPNPPPPDFPPNPHAEVDPHQNGHNGAAALYDPEPPEPAPPWTGPPPPWSPPAGHWSATITAKTSATSTSGRRPTKPGNPAAACSTPSTLTETKPTPLPEPDPKENPEHTLHDPIPPVPDHNDRVDKAEPNCALDIGTTLLLARQVVDLNQRNECFYGLSVTDHKEQPEISYETCKGSINARRDAMQLFLYNDVPPELSPERRVGQQIAFATDRTDNNIPLPPNPNRCRFDDLDLEVSCRIGQAFRELAAADPGRWQVIEADQPADQVAVQVWQSMLQMFSGLAPAAPPATKFQPTLDAAG